MRCSAEFDRTPAVEDGLPDVSVTFPDGQVCSSASADMAPMLSGYLNHPVELRRKEPAANHSYYARKIPSDLDSFKKRLGIPPSEALPDLSVYPLSDMVELSKFAAPPGLHTDAAPLHILTKNALQALDAAAPSLDVNAKRFRPNIIIALEKADAVVTEECWIDGFLHIGNTSIQIDYPTVRCAMPGQAQPTLGKEPQLARILRSEFGGFFGVYGQVLEAGQISEGDPVHFERRKGSAIRQVRSAIVRPAKRFLISKKLRSSSQQTPNKELLRRKGFQPVKLVRRETEAEDIVSFYFRFEKKHRYLPGQHATLLVPTRPAADLAFRRYTLSSHPSAPLLRITVKKEGDSNGSASHWLHTHWKTGDKLLVRPPLGQFWADPNSGAPLLLLSAGIGITPMMSILEASLLKRGTRKITFLTAAANPERAPWRKKLSELYQASQELTIAQYYPRDPIGVRLCPHERVGRIDKETLKEAVRNHPTTEAYVCGPPTFIAKMHAALLDLNIEQEQIHFESFGQPVDILSPQRGPRFKVHLSKTGKCVTQLSPAETILEMLDRENIALPSSCRYGACHACAAKLIRGEALHFDSADTVGLDENMVLCCSARPMSDIELEL
eukprot:s1_g216.t1